jgi:thiol-disulfide isomerase/thioredoxin
MAKTESIMLALGTKAPDFHLMDVTTGKLVRYVDGNQYPASVIMFICNHCPYVKHINQGLSSLAQEYQLKGVRFIAINSNDITNYPDDAPEQMKINAQNHHYPFPYLFDETQSVAQAYQAACTPDFFVFNGVGSLVYRGQLDDSRPGNNILVSGSSIRKALDCIMAEMPVDVLQKPSLGCNIKWKADEA